jgi:hypothetical protein
MISIIYVKHQAELTDEWHPLHSVQLLLPLGQ